MADGGGHTGGAPPLPTPGAKPGIESGSAATVAALSGAAGRTDLAADFWKDHRAWEERVLGEDLDITVSDPESSGGFRPFTTFRVAAAQYGTVVKRRFSDFVWLREVLGARFVGILMPCLPEKRGASSFLQSSKSDSDFVKTRMRALGIFMQRLIENPYLKKDSAIRHFLVVQSNRDWDAIKATQGGPTDGSENEGELRWRAAITRFELKPTAERLLVDMQAQLETVEKSMKEVCASAKRLADKAKAYTAELETFRVAYGAMERAEIMATDAGRVELVSKERSTAKILATTSMALGAWVKIAEYQPQMVDMIIYETLKYEVGQVAAMKDMIKQRDQMVQAHVKAARQLERREAELGSMTAGSASDDKIAKQTRIVAEDRAAKEKCEYVVAFMTKGLFFSEIDRFRGEKLSMIRDMFGQFGVTGYAFANKLSKLWSTLLEQLELNPTEMAARARKSMAAATALEGAAGAGAM